MKPMLIWMSVLLCLPAFAQKAEDFTVDGFIVMSGSTDTIVGKVKERNSYLGEQFGVWFMFPDGRMEKVKRKELSAMGMGDDLFLVRKFKGAGLMMYHVVVPGAVTLYEVVMSQDEPTYYLMKEGQDKVQMITLTPKGRGYKDQKKLRKYFADDAELYQKLDDKALTPPLLPQIVRTYNERHSHAGNGLNGKDLR